MALATAQRQDWLVNEMAKRKIAYRSDEPFSWRALFDQLATNRVRSGYHIQIIRRGSELQLRKVCGRTL